MKTALHLVLATWNHADLTQRFLDSLLKNTQMLWKLWIVDNASSDRTSQLLLDYQRRIPSLEIIQNSKNEGCARAWNRGIRAALEEDATLIGVVNNDIVLGPQWDRGLIQFWRNARPQPRVFSPSVDEGKLEGFEERAGLFCSRNFERVRRKMRSEALFVEAELFKKVGLFDEDFFVSFEDADFYLRLRENNIHPVTTGAARVWHQQKSSRKDLGADHEIQGQEIFRRKWPDPKVLRKSGWEASPWQRRYWRWRDRLGLL